MIWPPRSPLYVDLMSAGALIHEHRKAVSPADLLSAWYDFSAAVGLSVISTLEAAPARS